MNQIKSFRSIALLVFIIALFISVPFYGIILDGDELHSVIFSSGNKAQFNSGYSELMNQNLTALDWKIQLSHVNEFDLIKVWNDTLSYDVHPPLYHCLLHVLFYLFGGTIIVAYLLNAVFLLASLHLISSKRNMSFSSNWKIIAFLPFILNGCLDIRPYCMLFYFGLLCYFMLKEDKIPLLKFLLILILGLLTNYLFSIFILALVLSRIICRGSFYQSIIESKNLIISIIFVFVMVYFLLGHQDQVLTIVNRVDFDQHNILDKMTNIVFSIVGISFPIWIFKLANYLILSIFLLGLGFLLTYSLVRFLFRNTEEFRYEIGLIVIYLSVYLTLYLLEIIPHHSLGGKYFLLLTIPFILPMMEMLKNWNYVKFLSGSFLVLILLGEFFFRGNERDEISLMMKSKYSFYSNSNDVFTVLRLVHAMDDNKKVFIGDPAKTGNNHFDQLFIVTYKKPKIKYDANSLINESYIGKKMVLRKFLDIGIFYHK
ncbi:hypothetical protein N9335_00440 [Crocinitomicaceae bacterium]|nr:hypothetical protein [Crocinitomicaceae bacterium]